MWAVHGFISSNLGFSKNLSILLSVVVSCGKNFFDKLGFAILADTIKMLKVNSITVEVILVQGNHDRTKSFYLAHALDIFFSNDNVLN